MQQIKLLIEEVKTRHSKTLVFPETVQKTTSNEINKAKDIDILMPINDFFRK